VQFQPFTVFHRQRPFGKAPVRALHRADGGGMAHRLDPGGRQGFQGLQMEIRHRRLLVQQGHKGGHRMALRRADLARHGGRRKQRIMAFCA
jgi:hypothetical protein